jgi:hypothetical protein
MPLIYGEGEDNAFIRLREAIEKPLEGDYATPIRHRHSNQIMDMLNKTSVLNRLNYATAASFGLLG